MIVVGIDPGVTGAIACVDSHGTCAVEDLPVIEMGGAGRTQRKLCGRGLAELVLTGRWQTLDLSPLAFQRLLDHRPLIERNVI